MASIKPQGGFQNAGKSIAQKAASQAVQSAKAAAQTQVFEFAKSAQQQSGVPMGEVIKNPGEQSQPQGLQSIRDGNVTGLNPEEIRSREQALLNQWRNRLYQIQQEQAAAAQQAQEQHQAWKQTQDQQMQAMTKGSSQESPDAGSKQKKGFLKGMKAAIQQKVSKHETGRSAKH